MSEPGTSFVDDYELGDALSRFVGAPVDPICAEALGVAARPAFTEMVEAATAMAKIFDTLNSDHPELIQALKDLADGT